MSLEYFYNQKCILCYCHYDCNTVQPPAEQITRSIISSCLKHIPADINETVNWNELGKRNCLCFCGKCNDNIRTLSQLNLDLEEIQRKISEVVNDIIVNFGKEREKNIGDCLELQSKPSSTLLGNCLLENKTLEVNTHRKEKSAILLHDGDEVNNDVESINSDYNGRENSGEKEINQIAGDKSSIVSEKSSSLGSSLNSPILCKEQTKPKSSLQKLLESTSGFECSTCHKRFSRYTILKKHDCGKPTVECETCGLSFSSSGVLKLHTRSHTGEKPYKCETCGKAFSIKAILKTHIQSTHSEEKAFECEICGKKFGYVVALSKHKLTHVKEGLFKCDVCSKSFKRLKLLKLHFVTHTTETTHPYKCDLCDKSFPAAQYVTRHKNMTHFGQRPYQCDICEKSFSTNQVLKNHKMTHSEEKPFQCSHCRRNFRTSELLESHEWTHKDLGTFKCDICGKSYKNSHSLKLHARHHKENKVKCEICGKAISRSNIKAHIKTHRTETPSQCVICEKTLSSKDGQTSHAERFCHICKIFFFQDKSTD